MTYIRWLLFFYIPYRFAWFGAYIEQTGPPLLILNAPFFTSSNVCDWAVGMCKDHAGLLEDLLCCCSRMSLDRRSNHMLKVKLRGEGAQEICLGFCQTLSCERNVCQQKWWSKSEQCRSETSSIHLFKDNQRFKSVQNYCLRSLLFSRLGSLAKIFSWQLLHLHIQILIVRLKRAAHAFSKSRQKKHFECWRHERYL